MTDDLFQQRYGVAITPEEYRQLRDTVSEVLLGTDRTRALDYAQTLADLPYPLAFIYLELLGPVLYGLGHGWAICELSSTRIHIASALANSMMAMLYHRRISGISFYKPVVLVSCVVTNLHSIGSRMVADLLEEAHYKVIYLEPPVEKQSLLAFILEQQPAVAAFSVSMAEQMSELAMIGSTLRQRGYAGLIAAGGYVFANKHEQTARPEGVDIIESDPLAFIKWLDQHIIGGDGTV